MANDYNPTEATLKKLTINGKNYVEGGAANFFVKELRVYEDICKYYLTAQVVIEVMQNSWETLAVAPLSPVELDIRTGNPNDLQPYQQFFRVYSYDSMSMGQQSGGADVRLEITLNLVGQEFYNDRHNTVMKGSSGTVGTEIVKKLHAEFMQTQHAGPLEIKMPSDGIMGSSTVPHQMNNVKPVKAIFDILDQIIFHKEPTAAPVYFRDVNHHVVAPLKHLMTNGGSVAKFKHDPAQGTNYLNSFEAFNNIIDMKPLTPPSQVAAESAAALDSLLNTNVVKDVTTGNLKTLLAKSDSLVNDPQTRLKIERMIAEAKKGKYGGSVIFDMINTSQRAQSIDKSGSGHKLNQEAFITALSFCQKFWITVPINSGMTVTCGKNITVTYPYVEDGNVKNKPRSLFVPRLTHQLRFSKTGAGGKRDPVAVLGTTDIYAVQW